MTQQQPPLRNRVDPALAFTLDSAKVMAFLRTQGVVVATSAALSKCVISAADGSVSCMVGKEASFTIMLRDESNQPVTDVTVGMQLQVAWLDADGQISQCDVATSRLTVALSLTIPINGVCRTVGRMMLRPTHVRPRQRRQQRWWRRQVEIVAGGWSARIVCRSSCWTKICPAAH